MRKLLMFLADNNIEYVQSVDLKKKTWIKTGGIASFWITPTNIEQLKALGGFLYENQLSFDIVGYTSNLFFRNNYNPDIVISTIKLKNYSIETNKVICDCGVGISSLSKEFVKMGYEGYSGLIDLPGTVAAAAYNNASCYDCGMQTILDSVIILTKDLELKKLTINELGYSTRNSILKQKKLEGIIIQVILKVQLAPDASIEERKATEAHNTRKNRYEGPLNNLGSVYSHRVLRNNLRNTIYNILSKFVSLNQRQTKKLLLFMYGYRYLDHYISDRNLNTFIWVDSNAEKMFEEYNTFTNRVYRDVIREIEIKGEDI